MFTKTTARSYFDRQYALRKSLPGFAGDVAKWERLSKDACFENHEVFVENYGQHPRQTMEVFKADRGKTGRGLAIFIHGGFWRAMEREQSRFMATPFLKRGIDCIIIEYRLMPEFRLADLVEDTAAALRHIASISRSAGLSGNRIIAGHSAGAHLAVHGTALAQSQGLALPNDALLLFSGVYDIFPVAQTDIGDELKMSQAEVAQWSIYSGASTNNQPAVFVVGNDETDEFKRQTYLGAQMLGQDNQENIFIVENANHLTLLTSFCQNDQLFDTILADLTASWTG